MGTTLDLRTSSDVSGEYEIGFCARPSPDTTKQLPGHAFVSFSIKSQDGRRTFKAIGHTVQSGVSGASAAWSYFGDRVDGYLKEEKFTSAMQSCLVAKVNLSDYERAFALTKNALASMGAIPSDVPVFEFYKLGEDDCLSFMMNVANLLVSKGLKVPKRNPTELPLSYIQRFIEAN